jgi:chromate transport protein ChrA
VLSSILDVAIPEMGTTPISTSVREEGAQPGLRQFLLYFLYLGTLGFGGPIALAGYMQKDLVEERKWVSSEDYSEGLAFSQLSPGPLAAQLAMYLGWVRAGTLGATLTGAAFVVPSFLMVLALAAIYVHYGQLAWIQGAFYGIGAAVIAIIVRSAYKLIRSTLKNDRLLWALFAAMAITTAWTESEIVWLFLLCGLVAMLFKARPWIRVPPGASAIPVILGVANFAGGGRAQSAGSSLDGGDPYALFFLSEGGGIRLRQRTGDRAVSLRRSRGPVSVADGTAVR